MNNFLRAGQHVIHYIIVESLAINVRPVFHRFYKLVAEIS